MLHYRHILIALAWVTFAASTAAHGAPAQPSASLTDNQKIAVTLAGAQTALETPNTCGPQAGIKFRAASTISGPGISKSAPNLAISSGSVKQDAIDLSGWNLWVFNNADARLTNVRMKCAGASCTTGDIIMLGRDAGNSPHGPGTLEIDHFSFDGTGRSPRIQHSIYADLGSTLILKNGCLTYGAVNYIQTGGAANLYMSRDYVTAFCTEPTLFAGPGGDHCEALHFYGADAEIVDTFFDASALGPIVGGITALIYADPAAGTVQNIRLKRCILKHDGRFLYPLAMGGQGQVTMTISHCAIQRGANGHYLSGWNGPRTTVINGGDNYDLDSHRLIKTIN